MKKNILIYNRVPADLLETLSSKYNVFAFEGKESVAGQTFEQALAQSHAIIGGGKKFDAQNLQSAHNLEVIANVSVGYDNCDVAYLNKRGISLTNTPNVLNETTADLAIALMLATARRIPELDQWVKAGHWKHPIDHSSYGQQFFGADLHRKTLGVIGLGNIGQAIAKRAHFGFDMKILYTGRRSNPQLNQRFNAKYVDLDTLLQGSDFICPMVPLTEDTRHLISEREFSLMKRTAILVNVARGPIVDTAALIQALTSKQILAAGIDVYDQEPLQDSELFGQKNVITLPHIGSATQETRRAMAICAIQNACAVLEGMPPKNPVHSIT